MVLAAGATSPARTSRTVTLSAFRHVAGSRRRFVKARPVQASGRDAQNAASHPLPPSDDGLLRETSTIPEYMQQDGTESEELCESWEAMLRSGAGAGREAPGAGGSAANILWQTIRCEAEVDAAAEPLLSSFLYASILSHDSFERSLAFVLSNRLSDATFLSTELFEVFYSILRAKPPITEAALADITAVRERDPACMSYSQALLHFKGFHAIEAHRIAHELWGRGRRVMAVALQSRMSEVFAVDIHPAARFGKGILLDHGTGVVIGETAELGNNVSILQNVTLGGTGKAHGDRHPKISDNVLIGASASILGNIRVGRGAQVAAGSLVLKPVPPRTLVAGSPAKEIGTIKGNPALKMEQWCIDNKEMLKAHLEHDPFVAPPTSSSTPSSSSPAASGTGGSKRDGVGAGVSASWPQEQPLQHSQQQEPAAAPSSNSTVAATGELRTGGSGKVPQPAKPAAAGVLPRQQRAGLPQWLQASSATAKAAVQQPAGAASIGRPTPMRRGEKDVDAVTTDSASHKKWPAKASSPPEYFI